jgi:hypothetical protein
MTGIDALRPAGRVERLAHRRSGAEVPAPLVVYRRARGDPRPPKRSPLRTEAGARRAGIALLMGARGAAAGGRRQSSARRRPVARRREYRACRGHRRRRDRARSRPRARTFHPDARGRRHAPASVPEARGGIGGRLVARRVLFWRRAPGAARPTRLELPHGPRTRRPLGIDAARVRRIEAERADLDAAAAAYAAGFAGSWASRLGAASAARLCAAGNRRGRPHGIALPIHHGVVGRCAGSWGDVPSFAPGGSRSRSR